MKRAELLLTQKEGEKAVNEWIAQDWSVREISLSRGHWKDIVSVLAEAALKRFIQKGGVTRVAGTGGTLSRYEEIE